MTTRTRSLLAAAAALVLAAGAWWAQGSWGDGQSPASGGLVFQPVLGTPASGVRLIGAARQGAEGEVWGVSATSNSLLRYTRAAGAWQLVPVVGEQGADLGVAPEWATADVDDRGGVALLARAPTSDGPAGDGRLAVGGQGGFAVAPLPPLESTEPDPPAEQPPAGATTPSAAPESEPPTGAAAVATPMLLPGERLLPPQNGADGAGPALAATTETGGAGALVLPYRDGTARDPLAVLHWDRQAWTREPVCLDDSGPDGCSPVTGLDAPLLAVAPSGGAWLLGSVSGRPLLFQRVSADGRAPRWLGRRPQSWLLGGAAPVDAGAIVTARKLTATDQGLWADFRVTGTATGSATVLVGAAAPDGAPLGSWCQPLAICPGASGALAAPLPEGDYGSDAFAGSGDAGVRIISGLPNGALQRLQGGGTFDYLVGGGSGGQSAAFTAPDDGWLTITGAPQLTRVTTTPEASRLTAWPVPFRYPLLAVTPAPGSNPGDAGAAALAVGDRGQVARYKPGEGWLPEYMYGANGARAMPRLRAVAWPEPTRAYAVGDEGAMWVWRAETGLWEPDPAKPLNFHGNLGGLAFAPNDPDLGYAVGKQGVLLGYGRTWTQQTLPPGVEQEHFSAVAFAGRQALAVYRHGLLVDDGAGWRVDEQVAALLGRGILTRVAALPDGGAVLAGSGIVLERDGPTAPWRRSSQPLPLESAFNVSALAAVRDGAGVRALISVDLDAWSYPDGPGYADIDQPQPSAPGQPPLYIEADPLPVSGFLLRETANGWRDEQHGGFVDRVDTTAVDGPAWPDPVLALSVDAAGEQGWAVGGETGGRSRFGDTTRVQTAGVQRYGSGPAPPAGATAPVGGADGTISFALGGAAQCATPCADLANVGIGPDRWLQSAIQRAGQIPGLRAFLFAGPRLADSARAAGADAFARELARYGQLFRAAGGPLPAYAAISPAELATDGSTAPFAAALGTAAPVGSVAAGTPAPPAGTAAYSFDSAGAGGTVRVVVLDFSRGALVPGRGSGACAAGADPSGDQLDWLCAQLDAARAAGVPALVLGSADLRDVPDGTAVAASLVAHGASAYLFASRERNVQRTLGTAPRTIPAFGSGTLGYVPPPLAGDDDFLGEGGFLTLAVDVAERDAATNVAPVSASLVPNVGQLAIDAADGLLLRRSTVALFRALARRPLSGNRLTGSGSNRIQDPDPYVPIPNPCIGAACAERVQIAYRFSSSNPDIGDFVARDPNSTDPRAVLQGADGRPIADPTSGLFCAFNAGRTVVSVATGGLTYSQPVTIQRGTVQQPCGTVPLVNPPDAEPQRGVEETVPQLDPDEPEEPRRSTATPIEVSAAPPPPPPAAQQAPPPPHTPAARAPARPLPPAAVAAIPVAAALVPVPVRGAVPPPPPSPARPTPPSGTSQVQGQSPVSQSASAPERQREEEVATELNHHMAAYAPHDRQTVPTWPLVLLGSVLAAGAGATLRRDRAQLRLDRRRRLARSDGGERER